MKYFVTTRSNVEDACSSVVIFDDPADVNNEVKKMLDQFDEDVVIGTLDRVVLAPIIRGESVLDGLSTETYTPTPRKPRARKK